MLTVCLYPLEKRSGVGSYCRLLQKGLKGRVEFINIENSAVPGPPPRPFDAHNRQSEEQNRTGRFPGALAAGYLKDFALERRRLRKLKGRSVLLHLNRMGCEVDAIAARSLGGRRVIGTLHVMPGPNAAARHPVRRVVEWLSLRGVVRRIAISEAVAQAWSRRVRIPPGCFDVIYNGVDMEERDRGLRQPAANLAGGQRIIMASGRLHPLKGFDVLLKAVAALPASWGAQTRVVILGEGPEREQLERLAQALGMADRVLFTGHVDNVFSYLARADVFVAASRYEGFSLSVAEAMAMGCPCVVTDAGGQAELIRKSGGGCVVPLDDPDTMALELQRLLEDPPQRHTLGEKGRAFSEHNLSLHQMAEKTLKVYEGVSGAKSKE